MADTKIEQRHDMGMAQSDSTSLIEKVLEIFAVCQLQGEELHRHTCLFVQVLSQVDDSKGSSSQQAKQTILADLLTDTILVVSHLVPPFCEEPTAQFSLSIPDYRDKCTDITV